MASSIAISVINDLYSDQRVHRTCMLWEERGYEVILIGRKYPNSKELNRTYKIHRFNCFWNKGPLFYIEYQVRLWAFLKTLKVDVYLSNDLDTLLPNVFWSARNKLPLVYDSHEYFLGSPEIESRPVIKFIWSLAEKYAMPKVDYAVTVNDSISRQYHREYGKSFDVVRNVPLLQSSGFLFDNNFQQVKDDTRRKLLLPLKKPIWIIQGAGINIDRGAEELLEATMALKGEVLLLIVGNGDAIPKLKLTVKSNNLNNDIVRFIPRQSLESLREYTFAADLGFSLDKPRSQNYRWSLPNKIFDYWQAGIPVVSSNIIEVTKLIKSTQAGIITADNSVKSILEAARNLSKIKNYQKAKLAAEEAAKIYNWENEKKVWNNLISRLEGVKTIHIWSMDRLETTSYGGILEVQGQIESALKYNLQVIVYAWSKKGLYNPNPIQMPGVQFHTFVRKKTKIYLTKRIPYIVSSRRSKVAEHKSAVQRGMVLINGPHCSGIYHPKNAILRLHNPESIYYKSLAVRSNGMRSLYLRWESRRLREWEKKLAKEWNGQVWSLTSTDSDYWNQMTPLSKSKVVGPMKTFIFNIPQSKPNKKILLVPGKFSVIENENAALISLNSQDWEIIWAGHGASSNLKIKGASRVKYIDSPNDEYISKLFSDAQAVLVHADHKLGIKIKLIQALYQARFIIAHENALFEIPFCSSDGIFIYHDINTFLEALKLAEKASWNSLRATEILESRKKLLSKIHGSIEFIEV